MLSGLSAYLICPAVSDGYFSPVHTSLLDSANAPHLKQIQKEKNNLTELLEIQKTFGGLSLSPVPLSDPVPPPPEGKGRRDSEKAINAQHLDLIN